jgi:hypothetical protein
MSVADEEILGHRSDIPPRLWCEKAEKRRVPISDPGGDGEDNFGMKKLLGAKATSLPTKSGGIRRSKGEFWRSRVRGVGRRDQSLTKKNGT